MNFDNFLLLRRRRMPSAPPTPHSLSPRLAPMGRVPLHLPLLLLLTFILTSGALPPGSHRPGFSAAAAPSPGSLHALRAAGSGAGRWAAAAGELSGGRRDAGARERAAASTAETTAATRSAAGIQRFNLANGHTPSSAAAAQPLSSADAHTPSSAAGHPPSSAAGAPSVHGLPPSSSQAAPSGVLPLLPSSLAARRPRMLPDVSPTVAPSPPAFRVDRVFAGVNASSVATYNGASSAARPAPCQPALQNSALQRRLLLLGCVLQWLGRSFQLRMGRR